MSSLSTRAYLMFRGLDIRIVVTVFLLASVGLLGISLAGSMGRSSPDEISYGLVQLRWIVVGALLFVASMTLPYRWLVDNAWLLYVLSILGLLAVFAIWV